MLLCFGLTIFTLLSHASFLLLSRISIITLEDVLEALLQEQIYDESDKVEREANRVAKWAVKKWRSHIHRKKQARAASGDDGTEGGGGPSLMSRHMSMGTVVEQVIMEAHETSRLLPDKSTSDDNGDVHHPPHHHHNHHQNRHGLLQFWHGLFNRG